MAVGVGFVPAVSLALKGQTIGPSAKPPTVNADCAASASVAVPSTFGGMAEGPIVWPFKARTKWSRFR